MTTDKLRIGIFTSTLSSLSQRGANRLFHALYDCLCDRPDVEIFLLDDKITHAQSQTETLFSFHRPTEELAPEGSCFLLLRRLITFSERVRAYIDRLRAVHFTRLPLSLRVALKPFCWLAGIAFRMLRAFESRASLLAQKLKRNNLSRLSLVQLIKRLTAPDNTNFSNKEIVTETINIRTLDAILNFWWFHLPFQNPSCKLARPKGPMLYNWFLDAIPLRIPHWQEGFIPEDQFIERVTLNCNSCDKVIAISQSAADDATRFFGVKKEKISVVPCGIFKEDFFDKPVQRDPVIYRKYNLNPDLPLFLALGVQEPSKNTLNILKALQKVSAKAPTSFQFACIGAHDGFSPESRFGYVLEKLKGRVPVRFLGSLGEEDKRHLLASSKIFIYPSLWEGFGIPPLEAMAAGVPTIVSKLASLPAVCQEHALYCNPYSTDDMAEKIYEVMNWAEEQRSAHTDKAREYARQWLWERNATETLVSLIRENR